MEVTRNETIKGRDIGLERTYWLGDFRNLKVSDTITGIPIEVALNPEAMKQLRKLQMYQVDLAYIDYIKESATFNEEILNRDPDVLEEVYSRVETSRTTSLENLMEAVASVQPNVKEPEENNNESAKTNS